MAASIALAEGGITPLWIEGKYRMAEWMVVVSEGSGLHKCISSEHHSGMWKNYMLLEGYYNHEPRDRSNYHDKSYYAGPSGTHRFPWHLGSSLMWPRTAMFQIMYHHPDKCGRW
ncbi:hypothetical protein BS47DRAFT_175354 [Hydnum rufescens UP504]|uniref:Uncharacterized protein n=1 Tax=Hydnum rufescens UP504 TaxID=1448309 RepID=A0A9P6ANU9_9AGAM|nr:hypothetical protein BS47DRAFT_175354 [Hydnum rufescens UP504]